MPANLTSIGLLVIVIGFALVVVGALTNNQNNTKVAVGGFIGFIPFGFANDKRLLWALISFMAVALVFFFVSNFLLHGRFK